MKYRIGYTQGVYDMFHIGHLNLINRAKEQCDYLIVGVNSDELVRAYKKKETVIKEQERAEIVRNLKAVDECIIVNTLDKMTLCQKLRFDAIFIGDDWYGTEKWQKYEEEFAKEGIKIVYFPYTQGVSSTQIRRALDTIRVDNLEDVK